jgi:hypothetical protein
MALRPRRGTWAYGADAHTPVDAARPGLARAGRSRGLAAGDPGFPRRARQDLAGGRRGLGLVGGQTAPGAWWWPPPTRPPCRPRPPGTWSPTCPAPAARARPNARTRPPAWPRSRGSTRSATGSSRATSKSKMSWAGPTSRSAPMSRSAATRPWSTARSASAGTPGSLITRRRIRRLRGRDLAAERGGTGAAAPPPAPSWPRALRATRAWFPPGSRCSAGGRMVEGAPRQLQAPMTSLGAGCGLHLYLPN